MTHASRTPSPQQGPSRVASGPRCDFVVASGGTGQQILVADEHAEGHRACPPDAAAGPRRTGMLVLQLQFPTGQGRVRESTWLIDLPRILWREVVSCYEYALGSIGNRMCLHRRAQLLQPTYSSWVSPLTVGPALLSRRRSQHCPPSGRAYALVRRPEQADWQCKLQAQR